MCFNGTPKHQNGRVSVALASLAVALTFNLSLRLSLSVVIRLRSAEASSLSDSTLLSMDCAATDDRLDLGERSIS